jgi:hypothetical protein
MPSHYGNSMPKKKSNPMPEKVKKMLQGKEDKKSKKSKDDPSGSAEKSIKGFRKMTEQEKKLLAKHYEKNPHDKSQKAKMNSAVMKRMTPIKSMKGLEKLHKEVFSR